MGQVARDLGVDRATVSRWQREEVTASPDHCVALASCYPEYFDDELLLALHARSTLGPSVDSELTVGATVHHSTAAVYAAVTTAILAEEPAPRRRSVLHTAFHLDKRGADALEEDPHLPEETARAMAGFRDAMVRRAADGWRIRTVVVLGNRRRWKAVEPMIKSLDGPDVEIRAYRSSIPLAIAPLVIGGRDVFLAYDNRRWEKPDAAIQLRSSDVLAWATEYSSQLFADAPFELRGVHGPNPDVIGSFWDSLDD